MGRTLVPMAFAHFVLLDELLGSDLFDSEPDLATLEVVSKVCAARVPDAFTPPLTDDQRERFAMSLHQFEIGIEQETWHAYFDACFLSRPRIGTYEGAGESEDYRAPWPLVVTTLILRKASGYTRDQLWHDLPVSEALWCYEAVREQSGRSYLCRTDEPEAEQSTEEKATEAAHEARASRILETSLNERSKIAQRRHVADEERLKALADLDVWQARMLQLSAEGRLNDDLTEKPDA